MSVSSAFMLVRRASLATLLVGCIALPPAGRADVVALTAQAPQVNARVLRLLDGGIEVETPEGRTLRPIEQVEYLQVTGWQLFNLAEKQYRDGNVRQAVNSYEAALKDLADPRHAAREARSPVSAELDRVLLARCRLVRAYEKLGRFDKAVEVYLAAIESEGGAAYVEAIRPRRVPDAASPAVDAAHVMLEAAIGRHRGEPLGEMLERWRETLPAPQAHEPPTSAPAPLLNEHSRAMQAVIVEIQRLVEAGQEAQALDRIRPLQQDSSGFLRADLFYWEGRALLARSKQQSGSDAEADARRAGLAFMRVPIHFDGHPRTGECLYLAGAICAGAGLTAQAAQLWAEVIAYESETSQWARQARASLAKSAATTAPAG